MAHTTSHATTAPDPTPAPPLKVCVLGIGNVLWADEGFGVRCLEMFQQQYEVPDSVELIDGGTQGLYLLPYVQEADALLIFDAIDYGLEPGTLKRVQDEEVPRFLGAKKMSLHQTGFQEVLQLAILTNQYPRHVTLLGCQPEELEDYGGSLRPVVKKAAQQAVQQAVSCLREWGVVVVARPEISAPAQGDSLHALALDVYEGQRPSEELACRNGDDRFFPTAGAAA